MSNTPNDPSLDEELDGYLRGGSDYSRHYGQLDADTIPTELDAAILAQARRSDVTASLETAKAKKQESKYRKAVFWNRVSTPLAIAASLVITFSIVLQMNRQDALTPRAQKQSAGNTQETNIDMRAADSSPAPSIATREQESMIVAEEKRVAVSKPAPTEKALRDMGEPQAQAAIAQPSAPPSASPPAPTIASAPATASRTANSNANARNEVDAVIVTGAKRNESTQDVPIAISAISNEDLSSPTEQFRAGPRNTVPMRAETRSTATTKEMRAADPDLWLDYIRELRQNKRQRAADREWQAFVKAYPQVVVAEDDVARPKKK